MKPTFTLTAEDCIQARRLALRPRPAMRFALYVVLALFAICTIWSLIDGISSGHLDPIVWIFLGAGAYLYAMFFIWMPYSIRKVFN